MGRSFAIRKQWEIHFHTEDGNLLTSTFRERRLEELYSKWDFIEIFVNEVLLKFKLENSPPLRVRYQVLEFPWLIS